MSNSKYVLALFLMVYVHVCCGQQRKIHKTEVKISEDSTFIVEEIQPEFPGGVKALDQLVRDSLKYPSKSAKRKIGGKVYVKFVLDTTGNPTNIEIQEGINKELDAEAMRLVSLMKNWEPAYQNGKKVPIRFKIPIVFHPPK